MPKALAESDDGELGLTLMDDGTRAAVREDRATDAGGGAPLDLSRDRGVTHRVPSCCRWIGRRRLAPSPTERLTFANARLESGILSTSGT